MPIFATAGAKFYIGPAMAPVYGSALTASNFSAVDEEDWVQVEPLETIGTFGDSAEEVSWTSIGDARTHKLKGARDAGSLELVAGLDYANAGQIAMLAAEATPHSYAMKVVFNDAPPSGTPSTRRFLGIVMSASEELSEANSVAKVHFNISINSNVVRTAASA